MISTVVRVASIVLVILIFSNIWVKKRAKLFTLKYAVIAKMVNIKRLVAILLRHVITNAWLQTIELIVVTTLIIKFATFPIII